MSTNAQYAAIPSHPLATAWRGLSARLRGRAISGPAQTTETTPKPDGAGQMPALPLEVLIHRHAVRTCNRKPEQVAKSVRLHTILGRGRS